jgi:hypothetical protein
MVFKASNFWDGSSSFCLLLFFGEFGSLRRSIAQRIAPHVFPLLFLNTSHNSISVAGVARLQVPFFVRPKKGTKENPPCRAAPAGFLRIGRQIGRLRNSPWTACTNRKLLRSSNSARLHPNFPANPKRHRRDFKSKDLAHSASLMAGKPARFFWGWGLMLDFPFSPPSSTGRPGEVGEDCLSAKREFRSRPA